MGLIHFNVKREAIEVPLQTGLIKILTIEKGG